MGDVPRISTRMRMRDWGGTCMARLGMRNQYTVTPGLYAVGNPTPASPVLVTANYKLTFDAVRRELAGLDAWILVLDTRGINVWCAAGKKLFSTDEIILMVQHTQLAKVVEHRKLILPQYGATGVSAHKLKKACGFGADYGPIRASDIKAFIAAGNTAQPQMRQATFTLVERVVLIPVEITLLWKVFAYSVVAAFLLSGIGQNFFSFGTAWTRGMMLTVATACGIVAGAGVVPLLLPWLPGRAFSVKGTLTGLVASAGLLVAHWGQVGLAEALAICLWTTAVSSYLGMNFTGSTPYTSPTGVEKEMRRAIPLQAIGTVLAVILWVAAAFAV